MTAADQAPDPARPDAVQVPQVVAFGVVSPTGRWHVYRADEAEYADADWGPQYQRLPLVTEPDALAYAEALAGQRVREERIRNRRRRPCGCAWCCAATDPGQRGDAHSICLDPS